MKDIAKNIAAEQAVAQLIKDRHGTLPAQSGDVNEAVQESLNASWQGLASLAVFKLFNEWKSQVTF